LTADQVIERHIAAIGGADLLQKYTTQSTRGTIHVQGLEGTIETYQKAPDKSYQKVDLKVVVQESGCDGERAWRRDQGGLRELEGGERDQAREGAESDRILRYKDPKTFSSYALLGTEAVDGRPAYKVEFNTPTGGRHVSYFDAQTFLEVRRDANVVLGASTISREVYFSDFRDVKGLTVAFQMRQVTPFNETVIKLEQVDVGQPIDEAVFAMPQAAAGG
jgi:hypothetical protein